jgi:hypothetical protein
MVAWAVICFAHAFVFFDIEGWGTPENLPESPSGEDHNAEN